VTEIPEHLLARSRERRAALSGTEVATGEPTTAADSAASETPRAASPVPAEPQTAPRGGSGGGIEGPPRVTDEPMPEMARRPGPTHVKIPLWIMPVLAALPLWGILYLGAFGNRAKASANDPVVLGAAVYTANCATCHGATGGGGVGPQLSGGEVLKQWPRLADHIAWVHTGGAPHIGQTIGGVVVTTANEMPAFGSQNGGNLTDPQIAEVVCYERVTFGGSKEDANNCPVAGGTGTSGATGASGGSGASGSSGA
jgi:mono/diheme cytochrome c family protein